MFDVQPTPYDVRFRFLGFPVQIHPLFWVVMALLGSRGEIGNMSFWILSIAVWIAAAFVSILVHELGHALVFRHVHRVSSLIVLYGFGGLTIPMSAHRRDYGFAGMLKEVLLSFAGPGAGFLLAAAITFGVASFGVAQYGLPLSLKMAFLSFWHFSPEFFFALTGVEGLNVQFYLVLFLFELAFISIIWGIFNLLPIHPMDGGQISREIFSFFSPRHGVANSLGLSIAVAVAVGFLAAKYGLFFVAVLFGFFAFQNYRELTSGSFRHR